MKDTQRRYVMVEGTRARVDLDTFEMWHEVFMYHVDEPAKPLAQLVAENYEREHTYFPPGPAVAAVGLLFGSYYPTPVIEEVIGEKRVLATRALLAR